MANRFCHMELTAGDLEAAKKFYGDLFDWKIADMQIGEGSYTTISTGEKTVGGGMQAPQMPGQPTGWLVYTEVKSVKDALAKAESLGATIHLPFMPVGEMGAIGVFSDPQGNQMGVWESNAPPPAPKKKAAKKKAAPKKAAPKKAAKKAAPKKAAPKKAAPKKAAKKKK